MTWFEAQCVRSALEKWADDRVQDRGDPQLEELGYDGGSDCGSRAHQ